MKLEFLNDCVVVVRQELDVLNPLRRQAVYPWNEMPSDVIGDDRILADAHLSGPARAFCDALPQTDGDLDQWSDTVEHLLAEPLGGD